MRVGVSAAQAVVRTFVLLWLVVATTTAEAQLRFTATPSLVAPPAISSEVQGLIQRGQQLETERRWGEALTLYEDALRTWPEDKLLSQRFTLSRMHYDLGRRYNDASFRDSLAKLSPRECLELYGEVLLKIQSHYVHSPNWRNLFEHGALAIESALTDPVFVERHLSDVAPAKIEHFLRELRPQIEGFATQARWEQRQAAADGAALVARLGKESLGLDEPVVVMEFVCGATNALDPYSTYLTAGQLNEVYSQIEGNFVGLGVELKASEGSLLIVKVIAGSPAERSNIRAGDRIVAVDGRSTQELSTDQAANMLQGREGTWVDVTILAPGFQPRAVRVRREQIEVPSVDQVKIVDAPSGVGYLRITCFQKTTSRDVDSALWRLHRDGMKSLIIDLRGNPGGLLTSSVDLVDKFVDRGVIVSTRGRSPHEDYNYQAHANGTWRVPLVVLIDGDSASASEIFAGAVRDHHRGTIVGTRSYGKGSVQGIFPLNQLSAGLRLTTAKFYSPNGHPYSQVGVQPDVVVQEVARPIEQQVNTVTKLPATVDNALEAAKNVARSQVARR